MMVEKKFIIDTKLRQDMDRHQSILDFGVGHRNFSNGDPPYCCGGRINAGLRAEDLTPGLEREE